VLFNCIDYGSVFDFAVNSLYDPAAAACLLALECACSPCLVPLPRLLTRRSKQLGIPYVSGSSYANTIIVDFFTGKVPESHSCFNRALSS
jgi:hypothetical protein